MAGKLLGGGGSALPEGVTQSTLDAATKKAAETAGIGAGEGLSTALSQKAPLAQKAMQSDLLANISDKGVLPETFSEGFGRTSIMKAALPDALVGGLTAQTMQPLDPISIDDDSKITYKPGQPPKDRGTPVGGDIRTGRERDYGFELPKAQEGMLKLAEGGGLKALPSAEENPGIRKLPEDVRNKMGYMQEGGITSMIEGGAPDTGKNDKEIITGAVRAIAGISEKPQEDLALFVSKFGEGALEDLVERVRSGQFGANLMRGGEGLQRGAGDGMDDMIPANIEGEQDVLLSNDEFVVPADVVSGIGNGSSDAGAKALYDMMDRVRTARTGMTEQPPDVPQEEMLPV